jgi:hypothetical protein
MNAKYHLGKIKNKHLIFEILSYAFMKGDCLLLLHGANKLMRKLIKDNYFIAWNIILSFMGSSDEALRPVSLSLKELKLMIS